MTDVNKAVATQLANIEARSGKTIAQLKAIVKNSGFSKHMELVKMLKTAHGMGHGDANLVVHLALNPEKVTGAEDLSMAQVLDGLYTGPKASLRPIHDKLLAVMQQFGNFEEAPKKTYVSYRRKRQFCMIGPATNTRVEVGFNVKGLKATDRLLEQPAGRMCSYIVKITDVEQVDEELFAWIKTAYEAAG